jgi:LAO/AO transport system kinase
VLAAAAGFDRVIVETVGVGQSETEIADMVDLFILLIAPGGGGELQGLKRGILELADLVVVTKADGDLEPAARRAIADYAHALRLVRPQDTPDVRAVSVLEGRNMTEVTAAIERRAELLAASGERVRRRARQAEAAFWAEVAEGLRTMVREDRRLQKLLPDLQARVAAGTLLPAAAARQAVAAFLAPP